MKNDWQVTITFPEMPEDADEESMRTFVIAVLSSNSDMEFTIDKIEKVQ